MVLEVAELVEVAGIADTAVEDSLEVGLVDIPVELVGVEHVAVVGIVGAVCSSELAVEVQAFDT